MKVGFIGLGIMGKPMSKNLVRAGYQLVVYNRSKASVEELVGLGAMAVNSPKEVAEKSDVIITMLPDSPQVFEICLGKDGIIDGIRKGQVVIDMSSINPLKSRELSVVLSTNGVEFLDAPVSGGETKAIEGTISIMVGGKKEVFDKNFDIMKAMADSVVYVGEVGSGNIAKLANQVIVALNIAAIGEAFTLVAKAGVDPNLVYQAIRSGSAGSSLLDAKVSRILKRNFEPGFKIEHHIKDLKNTLDMSQELILSLPLTSNVMEIMQVLKEDGNEKDDNIGIVKYYEKLNKIVVEGDSK